MEGTARHIDTDRFWFSL